MRYVPLLVVPLVLYNAFAFLIFEDYAADFREASMLRFSLPSGEVFTLTVSATIIVLAMLLLAVEVAKAARSAAGSIVDNVLAAVLFIAFVAEFLIVRQAATGTFLLLTAVAFVDLVCGLALSLRPSPSEEIGPPS